MGKIFGIGLSRTGTTSLYQLMNDLGIKSIHLPDSYQEIDEYMFVNDTSVSARFEELDRLYPNSKFIYTTRKLDQWVDSCLRWVGIASRGVWYKNLPSDQARQWISEGDFRLYGYYFMDMPSITRKELIAAYTRHEQRVTNYFKDRPYDLLTIEITDAESLPFTKLVKFLEEHGLLRVPKINSLPLKSKQLAPSEAEHRKPNSKPMERDRNDSHNSSDVQCKLAQIWHQKGKMERAIAGYQKTLDLKPDHLLAFIELGNLLISQERISESINIYKQALIPHPNEGSLHKGLVNALVAHSGLDEAFRYYELVRKDNRTVEINPQGIICCVVVRNEAVRLPFFLSYYRKKGVDRFLIVDNDSDDQTLSYLLEQHDVYVWHSAYSFNKANFGAGWFELLLRKYGVGHWCLIVDADELFYYPDCEHKNIRQLCQELDRKNKRAFDAVLLDMYSNKPIRETYYKQGQDFLEVCPYFDRNFYHTKYENAGPYNNQTCYLGGARQRVFSEDGDYYLSKVPLLKYNPDFILAGGQHWTNQPIGEIALESGCLLHFKYFSSFHNYVKQEIERKEHYCGAMQYNRYAQAITKNEDLSLYDEKHSVRLQNSSQLVDLGIMQSSGTSNRRCSDIVSAKVPRIRSLSVEVPRPFWSVMITVYNRTQYIQRALKSIIDQAQDPQQMQIEVVNDGTSESIHAEIEAIVRAIGGNRVTFYRHHDNAGHPHIFNICLERAVGRWIHILHDDDWVKPGFYRALQTGIEQMPAIGAAFCRQMHTDASGHQRWVSWLERDTPGIISDWLERIAVKCRVQFSSMVVKREAYEKLGGFCEQAKSAWDWDMWKRIAVYYPVWFEPALLTCSSKDVGDAETDHLIKSGGQIADARRSIEISRLYLPGTAVERLSNRALEHYARYALDVAKEQLKRGDAKAALENVREGLKCSQSAHVKEKLLSLLLKSKEDIETNDQTQKVNIFKIKENPEGKINLYNQKTFKCHRSGWDFVLKALAPLHNSLGILFDGFIENNFAWLHTHEGIRSTVVLEKLKREGTFEKLASSEERGITPYKVPWVGFIHNPQGIPKWFHYRESPQAIFAKDIWKQSLPYCLGLFTFTEYHARWLRENTGEPVSTLIFPTEIPDLQFDFNNFMANPHKKIILIGWWLRKLNAIYQLPIPKNNPLNYEKVRLVPLFFDNADKYLQELMKQERGISNLSIDPDYLQNTKEIIHVSNSEYDQLLSENIVFVSLYDASANNVVIECIARATPLLINPLPAVVEYLGEDYPMYFNSLSEAAEKALDTSLIRDTHKYLRNCEIRNKLSTEYFLNSFRESEVYRSI